MYNIIIFGTGNCAAILKQRLNSNINIVAYLDNDKLKWHKIKGKTTILPPCYIKKMFYDYIIIASQYDDLIYKQLIHEGINYKKILRFHTFINEGINTFKNQLNVLKASNKPEIIATGISYSKDGLKENILRRECLNFSNDSQDLYYDYNIVKYILDKFPYKLKHVRYCIIGLCYYSFQYDLSLSRFRDKSIRYYSIIKKSNNIIDMNEIFSQNNIELNIYNIIIDEKYKLDYINVPKYDIFSQKKYSINYKINLGKIQAQRDCKKNYPETVIANIKILQKYMLMLKCNNIFPIIVIYPVTKYYSDAFNKKIELEFKKIITELKKQYNFKYIDYFRNSDFKNDDYFKDVSHLNEKGSIKFTKILNNEIYI